MKPLVKLLQVTLHVHENDLFGEINLAVSIFIIFIKKKSVITLSQVTENTCAAIEHITGTKGNYYWGAMSKYLSRRFLRPVVNKYPHKKYNSVLAAYQKLTLQYAYLFF